MGFRDPYRNDTLLQLSSNFLQPKLSPSVPTPKRTCSFMLFGQVIEVNEPVKEPLELQRGKSIEVSCKRPRLELPSGLSWGGNLGSPASSSVTTKMRERQDCATWQQQEQSRRGYACRFCGRSFRAFRALGGHMNSHKKERQLEFQDIHGVAQRPPAVTSDVISTADSLQSYPEPFRLSSFGLPIVVAGRHSPAAASAEKGN